MAYLRPSQTWNLSRDYGGIFWHYWEGSIYGVVAQGDITTQRANVYKLEQGSEELFGQLEIKGSGALADTPIRCATFISGQVGIIADFRERNAQGWLYNAQSTFWFRWPDLQHVAERRLWDGVKAFTCREEGGHRVYFFQGPAQGNVVRWSDNAAHDPGKTGQYMPFDGGIIGGFDFQDCYLTELITYISPNLPTQMLIIATRNGHVGWYDVSEWSDTVQSLKFYKGFHAKGATDIQDICIDRNNNVLYVLNGARTILVYDLEPFGTEEGTPENNTPVGLNLYFDDPNDAITPPGVEIQINGHFVDMWDVVIDRSGIAYKLLSGNNLGKFKDGEQWDRKVEGVTGSDGTFSVIFKGDV